MPLRDILVSVERGPTDECVIPRVYNACIGQSSQEGNDRK